MRLSVILRTAVVYVEDVRDRVMWRYSIKVPEQLIYRGEETEKEEGLETKVTAISF